MPRIYRAQPYRNLWLVTAAAGSNTIEPSLLRLLIDTGSSYTVLPSRVLETMGCNLACVTCWTSQSIGCNKTAATINAVVNNTGVVATFATRMKYTART
jgi:predicted aspartyl protease